MVKKILIFIVLLLIVLAYSGWRYVKKTEWLKGNYLRSETLALSESSPFTNLSDSTCKIISRQYSPFITITSSKIFKSLASQYCEYPHPCFIFQIEEKKYAQCKNSIEGSISLAQLPCEREFLANHGDVFSRDLFGCSVGKPLSLGDYQIINEEGIYTIILPYVLKK